MSFGVGDSTLIILPGSCFIGASLQSDVLNCTLVLEMGHEKRTLSRRDLLRGTVGTALIAGGASLSKSAFAGTINVPAGTIVGSSLRRYMAASAPLGDGRLLITGGYDQPWIEGRTLFALASAMIFDPSSQTFQNVAPMLLPRARHAAASLGDGRIVVIGGISSKPTGAVEIYDPTTNMWSPSKPLANARYDHVATSDGSAVIVMGGSSQAIASSIETIYPASILPY